MTHINTTDFSKSKHWNDGYTCIGNDFWLDEDLTVYELKLLGILLTFHYCDEKPIATSYLIKISKIGRTTVIAGIKKLISLKYIEEVKPPTVSSCRYIRLIDKYVVGKKSDLVQETTQPVSPEDTPLCREVYPNKVTNKEITKKEVYSQVAPDVTPLRHTSKNKKNPVIEEAITYLNVKAGKQFKNSKASTKHLLARIKDGYTLEDFKAVIDRKVDEWSGTKMDKFLRPATLFNAEKFEAYMNEKSKRDIDKELQSMLLPPN